jgi:tetratricopeptide (TPR) repeat protein
MKFIVTQASQVTDINCSIKRYGIRDTKFELSCPFRETLSRIANRVSRIAVVFAIATGCVGCHTGTLADPNDVATAGPDSAAVIMAQLQVAADSLNLRKDNREIDDRGYRLIFAKVARDYIAEAKDKTITDQNASTWGKVYVTALDWKDAEIALQQAVKADQEPAKTDFKMLGVLVGDTLALAGAQAHLGKVHDAVATARSVFNVAPKAKAPILTSILYDVVPAGVRHGGTIELADLIKDAIKQHEEVLVDPSTDGGRDFLLARPHHIQRAWQEAALLYDAGGRHDLASDALGQAHKAASVSIRL